MTLSSDYDIMIVATDDPYPHYRWLRDNDPAHYSQSADLWVLTRYQDVYDSLRDWSTWSSERRGNLVNDVPERVGKTLGTMDPPAHRWARSVVNKAFTPRTVADLGPEIQSQARKLTQAAREKGTIDFAEEISSPYNAGILGAMFGVPESDFIQMRHWLDDFLKREDTPPGEEPKQVVAIRNLRLYIEDLANRRQGSDQDDLMTAMFQAEDEGRKLEYSQVVMTSLTFLVAGFESTNNLFTNLAYALDTHPDVYAAIKADPSLVPAFVEEGMRYDAAAQGFVRSPNQDVEMHGKVIPEGAQVLMHIGSANRDERQFEDPDTFDIDRNSKHLGMGQGIHACVAAQLGRQMAYTLFEELIAISDDWHVDLSKAERARTPNFRGFTRLPLTIA